MTVVLLNQRKCRQAQEFVIHEHICLSNSTAEGTTLQ